MPSTQHLGPTAFSVAEAYVQRLKRAGELVSTAAAVSAVRSRIPRCTYSDQELADFISAVAVAARCDVAFDFVATRTTEMPPFRRQSPDPAGPQASDEKEERTSSGRDPAAGPAQPTSV